MSHRHFACRSSGTVLEGSHGSAQRGKTENQQMQKVKSGDFSNLEVIQALESLSLAQPNRI